ncbi:YppG family protein [Ornithinibacillus bavariensis]|uniref:YppG-like protein n=1 Tax=Ornithinibacillus bavariensis TaxID=545502 RepID=A0A920C7F6_9BACI|nr:YppG family protein [Ornithinibacillus bavariensis]GIO27129.1 hypothetical protein J43TS3_17400 [Ornithinibacillus bavariensis]HAM82214.1 hypothetical protein [Ornithinibacillus sp.]
MRQFGQPPYPYQNYQQSYQDLQQPFHPAQQMHFQSMLQQPKTPFEQFSKPKQPQDWYANNQALQGNLQQAQGFPQPIKKSQFHDQNGQLNLDKVLSTVSQLANTYHQVSPIVKQFGDFMKIFR